MGVVSDSFSPVGEAWLWFSDLSYRAQLNVEVWLMKNPPAETYPLVHARANITDDDLYRGCE